MGGERSDEPRSRRGAGLTLSPLTVLTGLAMLGIAVLSLVYVATAFVLDDNEKALAERFAGLAEGRETSLGDLLDGAWRDACVLNTALADPGKVKTPDKLPGMLIPPMRHHANFLKSGFWVIVTLDGTGAISGEYRVDPRGLANRAADNGGNFCAPREKLDFVIEACSEDCGRRIVFRR